MTTLREKRWQGELLLDHSLSRYTSWQIGGVARQFYKPVDLEDCVHFLADLPKDRRVVFLGLGSNILFPDGVLNATVISTRGAFTQLKQIDALSVRAEAGVTCSKLAKFAAARGAESAAFFAGIPGTVGGALAMNAGAFGGETWKHVQAVECLARDGSRQMYTPQAFQVSYRSVLGPDVFFSAGIFKFPDLNGPDVRAAIKTLLKRRNDAQPIGTFNCGSVFRNPEGDYAARLIEAAHLKGVRVGDAQVSEKHANFILNLGQATAQDVRALMSKIQAVVAEVHGVDLVPEVHVIE